MRTRKSITHISAALVGALLVLAGSVYAGRDGSGNYTLPSGNPVSTGTTISSTWANNTLSDIATALTNSLSKDGQTVPTANLPMGGFKHTNVADATLRTQYAAAGQVQDGDLNVLTSVSGTNTILGTLTPAITSYSAGMSVVLIPANNNSGAATLNVNGVGALDVQKFDGDALASGDLVAGIPALLMLDTGGDDFILVNPQTGDMAAATILSRLLTVDGSGSGLDADTVDGATPWNSTNDGAGSGLDADLLDGSSSAAFAAASHAHSAADVTSGTLAIARGGTGTTDGTARNITGKAGVAKTLSTSAASGGSDGDVWFRY